LEAIVSPDHDSYPALDACMSRQILTGAVSCRGDPLSGLW
jgi:hypothetical protein